MTKKPKIHTPTSSSKRKLIKPKFPIPLFWPAYDGAEIQGAMAKLFPLDMSNRWLGQAHLVEEYARAFLGVCADALGGTARVARS